MKTIIKIFICLSLIYTPFFALAGAAEKWEVLENNYDHVSNKVKIEARKITQDAANSGRYKVQVPVSPAALGKTVKTMMWTGLAVAGVEAMLEGIGWIIDHGSKVIKRPKESDENKPLDPSMQYYWIYPTDPKLSCTSSGGCKSMLTPLAKVNQWEVISCSVGANLNMFCPLVKYNNDGSVKDRTTEELYIRTNPNYDPSQPPPSEEYEYLSDSALGNEIIGKGENTQPLPDAVEEAYSPNNPAQSEPAPQATQDALDNANPQPDSEPAGETKPKPNVDTDGDGEPDTYDPEQPEQGTEFQLPNFCSWAPAVCDFFKVQKADNKDIKNNQREQIEQDKTFFEKVREWFDWSQADDELPDNESPEIVEHITPDLKEDAISWVSSCPADEYVPISLQGVTSTLVLSWSPWCQLLSIIKPAIIASAYIGAAFIVLGIRT